MPATGREVTFQVMDVFRLAGNKIVEQWVVIDALGLLQQIGAVPDSG
jgi:predicted ester cyclase